MIARTLGHLTSNRYDEMMKYMQQ